VLLSHDSHETDKLKNNSDGPAQALDQKDEAVPVPPEITHRNSRPRLSGEGADAALQHLIERETMMAENRLP